MMNPLPRPGSLAEHWILDPEVVFLNHGSYGATPKAVLDTQTEIRRKIEAEPLRFFDRHYLHELDLARRDLAHFLGADENNLVFACNATTGVNTVLNALRLDQGDELLVTDHEYNACRNAVEKVAAAAGAVVVVAPIPFPLTGDDEVVESILERVTKKTRLLLVDHVTSQTGVVLPVRRLVVEMAAREVDVLVDGAHAPGMLELDLETLGAAFYVGNCHKWMCAPKGAAFLYVREDHHDLVRPLVISHGANASTARRSRFRLEHDWTGTRDPSGWLAVRAAIRVMEGMLPGGWDEIRRHNRRLALEGRKIVCDALAIEEPCPEAMIGSLASMPLPDGKASTSEGPFSIDPLQNRLLDEWRIEVPVIGWPSHPRRLLRISSQLYNSRDQYLYLAQALTDAPL